MRRKLQPVTEREYLQARRAYLRDGELTTELHQELVEVVRRMIRRRLLPPSFSPYGHWDQEAADEVFQAWMTRKLLEAGQLRPLVARAGGLYVFRANAERSLRHFLLNERDRSQRLNLFARIRALLDEDPRFRCVVPSQQAQNRWYGLHDWDEAEAFDGNPRSLRSAAWSAGDLAIVRYRANARKLSPVLDADELKRFVLVMFNVIGALLTPRHLLDGLATRVDIGDPEFSELEAAEAPTPHAPTVDEEIDVRGLAVTALAELTGRQARVLLGTADGLTLEDLAGELGCSRATVLNEQRRAGVLLTRLSGDDHDRELLLNYVLDLLYDSN
jgi:DNA-binding CsgD family transcriptional regulator